MQTLRRLSRRWTPTRLMARLSRRARRREYPAVQVGLALQAKRTKAGHDASPAPAPAVAQTANTPGFPRRENPSSESPF